MRPDGALELAPFGRFGETDGALRLPRRGQPLHTRSLTLVLTQRPDGLLRAAGEVIDLRKAGKVPMVEELQTAGIIHHMRIDVLIQPESRRIERIDVEQPAVAVEASEITYNQSCRDPSARLQELTGRAVDAALPGAVLDRVPGGLPPGRFAARVRAAEDRPGRPPSWKLVNHYAARATHEAVSEVERAVRYLKKFDKDGTRASLDQEYLDQIDQLLERFDLRQATQKELAKRASLVDWVEKQRAAGFEPTIDKQLLAGRPSVRTTAR